MAVNTDVHGDQYQALDTLFKKFPFGEQIKRHLLKSLAKEATGREPPGRRRAAARQPVRGRRRRASSLLDGSDENGFVAAIRVS